MASEALSRSLAGGLPPGTPVEVRTRYDGRWVRGFTVADSAGDAYHLQRADGSMLPASFRSDDLREDRQRRS